MGGWVGLVGWVWVGGFGWVWVGLGRLTIISDFRGTRGSGETVKKKNGNLIHVQLTALHPSLKWMRFYFLNLSLKRL